MNKKNSYGRMIWSGKNGSGPAEKQSRKSRWGSVGLMLVLVLVLTMFLTTTVYAAEMEPIYQDISIWGEGFISDDGGTSTDGYIWGESIISIGDDIGILPYGYAWGE